MGVTVTIHDPDAEPGEEDRVVDLDTIGYLVLTGRTHEVTSYQKWPMSGTAQFTIKRVPSGAPGSVPDTPNEG